MKSALWSIVFFVLSFAAATGQEEAVADICERFTFRKVSLGMTVQQLQAAKASVQKPLLRHPVVKRLYPKDDVRVVFDDGPKSRQQFTEAVLGVDGRVRALFLSAESDLSLIGTIVRGKATGKEIHDALVDKLGAPVVPRHVTELQVVSSAFKTTEVPQYLTVWVDEECDAAVSFMEISELGVNWFATGSAEQQAQSIQKFIWVARPADLGEGLPDRRSAATKAVE